MSEFILPSLFSMARQMGAFQTPGNNDKQRQEQLMWSMKTIGGLLGRGDLAPSSRENIQRTLMGIYGSLPDTLRPGAQALLQSVHMSPEEMKLNAFSASNPQPQPPTDFQGVPLPRTPENEGAWASYLFDGMSHRKAAMTHAFGKGVADEIVKIPKLLQINPGSENFWARDEQTGMTLPIALGAVGYNLEDAHRRGWTTARIAMEGTFPTADARNMTIGGVETGITPVIDLKTGKTGYDVQSYGEAEPKPFPKEIHDAFIGAAMGTDDAIKNLSGGTRNLAQLFSNIPKTFNKLDELTPHLEQVQQALGFIDPSIQVFPTVTYDSETKQLHGAKKRTLGWIPLRDTYAVDGMPFMLQRTYGTITVMDSNGIPGQVHIAKKENGQEIALDGQGQPIPGSEGVEEGASIPGITFAAPRIPDAPQKRPGTLGDLLKEAQKIAAPGTMTDAIKRTEDYIDLVSKQMDMSKKEILNFDKEAFIAFVEAAVKSAGWPLKAYMAWVRQFENLPIPGYEVEEK